MKSILRGESPGEILFTLETVEEVLPNKFNRHGRDSHPHKPVFFCKDGWARIHDKTSQRCFSWAYPYHKYIGHTTSAASLFRVKNNILALYPTQKLCCKIRRPNSARPILSLTNEYNVLREIVLLGSINAPIPIEFNDSSVQTLWIEYIASKKPRDSEKPLIAKEYACSLFRWYEYKGISSINSDNYQPLLQYSSMGSEGLIELGWDPESSKIIESALLKTLNSNTKFLVSQIHGDASIGNCMLDSHRRLIITDWECSCIDCIAYDMTKLSHLSEKVKTEYSSFRRRVLGTNHASTSFELDTISILSKLDLRSLEEYLKNIIKLSTKKMKIQKRIAKKFVLDRCHSMLCQ